MSEKSIKKEVIIIVKIKKMLYRFELLFIDPLFVHSYSSVYKDSYSDFRRPGSCMRLCETVFFHLKFEKIRTGVLWNEAEGVGSPGPAWIAFLLDINVTNWDVQLALK